MADATVNIAGPNGLDTDGLEHLAATSVVPVDVYVGAGVIKTLGATIAQLLAGLGDIGASGDVNVTGHIGALAFAIKNGHVTLGMLADLPANSVIGAAAEGPAHALTIGSGLHIAGGQLVADAVATVQPGLALLFYTRYGKL